MMDGVLEVKREDILKVVGRWTYPRYIILYKVIYQVSCEMSTHIFDQYEMTFFRHFDLQIIFVSSDVETRLRVCQGSGKVYF